MRSKILIIAMFSATAVFGGVTATWTGAEDSFWTNAANWLVDGAVPTKCPGVVSNVVDGVFAPDLPSGDIALFDGTCENGRTTIDLDGLYSVQPVEVAGENCPRYTFGVSAAQMLPLETNGVFKVNATVPASSCPVVNAVLATSNFDYDWWSKEGIGMMLTVINNSSGTIEFNSLFAAQRRRPFSKTAYKEFEVELAGTGNFRFNCNQSHDNPWLPTYYYKHSGKNRDQCEFHRAEKSERIGLVSCCNCRGLHLRNIRWKQCRV